MNSSCVAVGTQIAVPPPCASQSFASAVASSHTLKDLLEVIRESADKKKHMLRTTAGHLSEFFDKPIDKIGVEELMTVNSDFSVFLKQRRYAINSVRSYFHLSQLLVEWAEGLGWLPRKRTAEESWDQVRVALYGKVHGGVIRFAIQRGKTPAEFSDSDLDAWGESLLRAGRQHRFATISKSNFRKAVVRENLKSLLPKISTTTRSSYKVRTADMPEPLRAEVREILTWKQAKYVKGRPHKIRHRPVTAQVFESVIGRLYGFARDIAGFTDVTTLSALFTERVVGAYFEWGINERGLSRKSLVQLSMLYGTMRHHPKYKASDFTWFSGLFEDIPEEDASRLQEKKARKYVPYHRLREIPSSIRDVRLQLPEDSAKVSWLVHDELLMQWLTTLPWRQRNIRECRVGEIETANLVFAELPELVHVARPKWVEEELHKNPHQRFWHFHFREEETKTGQPVRGILPRCLIGPLEDYLTNHRPRLVAASDPGTLFLNREGRANDIRQFNGLVTEIVLHYAGKPMNPHLFRDAFAYAYLESHPEDYLTLSKILWHSSVKYTLSVYGKNFDESNGARRIDEWLGA